MYEYGVEILRAVDGDTLDIKIDLGFNTFLRERMRLYGVDTPEKYGKNAEPDPANAAIDFVLDWVAKGKAFRLVSNKYDDREKYGRVLGTIFRDDDATSLNTALVEAGHAKVRWA